MSENCCNFASRKRMRGLASIKPTYKNTKSKMKESLNTFEQTMYAMQVQLYNYCMFTFKDFGNALRDADITDLIVYNELFESLKEFIHDDLMNW